METGRRDICTEPSPPEPSFAFLISLQKLSGGTEGTQMPDTDGPDTVGPATPMKEATEVFTCQLPRSLVNALRVTSTQRKVEGRSPSKQKEIVAQALETWLTQHGALSA